MRDRTRESDVSRRRFLTQGTVALAAGSAAVLGAPEIALAQEKRKLHPCWSHDMAETTWSRYGRLRAAVVGERGKSVCVPLSLSSPDDLSSIDWIAETPTVRLGKATPITFTPKGISLKKGDPLKSWSKETTTALMDMVTKSDELQRAAITLRTAWLATYPEHCYRRKAAAPAKLAKRIQATHASIAQFTKGKSADHCKMERVVETVTTTVTRQQDVITTAADQFLKCTEDCGKKFGNDPFKVLDLLACEAGCLGKAFVDVVTGTIEVVETFVEEVVRMVMVCPPKLPKGRFPNPFAGLVDLPGFTGAVQPPKIDADLIKKAQGILGDLAKRLPPVVTCLIGGNWKMTSLGDLGLNIDGIAQVPFGVTVCLDRACTDTISAAGGLDVIGVISSLVGMLSAVTVEALVAAGIAAATAAVLHQVLVAIIVVIVVLLVHLLIVAGQVFIYDALGAIPNGVCITHPSVPIAVATVANPLLGILAVANTPLVVTPA